MATAERRDPGLQGERTALAWSRTGLAVLVNALVVLRSGLSYGSRPIAVLGVALLLAACGVMLYGVQRKRQLAAPALPTAPPRRCRSS